MSNVVTVVTGILDIELNEEQIAALESKLKVKSVPRKKMNFMAGDGDAGEVKLAPQAKILISVLTDTPMSMEEWGDAAAEAGMKTKQDPARIAAYYRKTLVENNLVKEVAAE